MATEVQRTCDHHFVAATSELDECGLCGLLKKRTTTFKKPNAKVPRGFIGGTGLTPFPKRKKAIKPDACDHDYRWIDGVLRCNTCKKRKPYERSMEGPVKYTPEEKKKLKKMRKSEFTMRAAHRINHHYVA